MGALQNKWKTAKKKAIAGGVTKKFYGGGDLGKKLGKLDSAYEAFMKVKAAGNPAKIEAASKKTLGFAKPVPIVVTSYLKNTKAALGQKPDAGVKAGLNVAKAALEGLQAEYRAMATVLLKAQSESGPSIEIDRKVKLDAAWWKKNLGKVLKAPKYEKALAIVAAADKQFTKAMGSKPKDFDGAIKALTIQEAAWKAGLGELKSAESKAKKQGQEVHDSLRQLMQKASVEMIRSKDLAKTTRDHAADAGS